MSTRTPFHRRGKEQEFSQRVSDDVVLVRDAVNQAVPLRRVLTPVVALVVLLTSGVMATQLSLRPAASSSILNAPFPMGSCSFDRRYDPGRQHVLNAPHYSVDPPAGGPHFPVPAPPGTYTTVNVPADGYLVHSLEHGYVILWYNDSASNSGPPAAVVQAMASFRRDVIIAPRALGDVAIAATAWHARLLCDQVDSGQLAAFVRTFRNQGPERVPH